MNMETPNHGILDFFFVDFKCYYLTGIKYLSTAVLICYFEVLIPLCGRWQYFQARSKTSLNYRKGPKCFSEKIKKTQGLENFQIRKTKPCTLIRFKLWENRFPSFFPKNYVIFFPFRWNEDNCWWFHYVKGKFNSWSSLTLDHISLARIFFLLQVIIFLFKNAQASLRSEVAVSR